jgi:NUMOD3 motif
MTKKCELCPNVMRRQNYNKQEWTRKRFCSIACLALSFVGKPLSEAHRRKLALAKLGKRRTPHTEETKRKMSAATRGVPRPRWRGPANGMWKGGSTSLGVQIRGTLKYREWRTTVFTRDGFVCVVGGTAHGRQIQADHIKPFIRILRENGIRSVEDAEICAELWDIANGRTLCIPCHKATPSYLRGSIRGPDKVPRRRPLKTKNT